MGKLSKETAVRAWFFRGLEDLFLAFRIESPFRYEPFFNTMGFEMMCKAYLLAEKANEYENLEQDKAIHKIDKLTKEWGHDFKKMVNNIKDNIKDSNFSKVLSDDYDGYTGDQFIEVMEAAYLECRYPVTNPIHEKFPIDGHPDMYWEPLCSSGLGKFCFAFTRKVVAYLKKKFNISIPKDEFDKIITGKVGIRFCNLFLKDCREDFLT
jgi:hypothetical protein